MQRTWILCPNHFCCRAGSLYFCPRQCKADRAAGQTGFCGAGRTPERPARPCTLGGALHQRHPGQRHGVFLRLHPQVLLLPELPHQRRGLGKEITVERLAEIFLDLQAQGAHNSTLSRLGSGGPGSFAALDLARAQGLHLPIVCNTGGYETVESVHAWRGFIDIWLADLKYVSPALSAELSAAPDYFAQARPAIEAMMAQAGHPVFDSEGILQRGVILAPPCPARPCGRQLCRARSDGGLEQGRPRVLPAQRDEPVHPPSIRRQTTASGGASPPTNTAGWSTTPWIWGSTLAICSRRAVQRKSIRPALT